MQTMTCKRHGTETRLACSSCGEPICPRCAVPAAVGQKCPDCARQARSARAVGKPRQYVKALLAAVVAVPVCAVALWFLFALPWLGWFGWIIAWFGGYAVGRAVRTGAEGNGATPFLVIAVVASVIAVEAVWLASGRILPASPFDLVTYLVAAWGAWTVFR